MFFETIQTPGLAHLSYVIGDDGQAAVIDPRWDIDVYLCAARDHGARITLVFETHRNEDIVSGARALAESTGARVLHGTAPAFDYGEGIGDGAVLELGALRFTVLHTPGHTDESISIAFADTGSSLEPVGVFSGDALLVGDVGRSDFYPERAEEVAGLLHRSVVERLLPLGDHVLLHPAHGAGSICGGAIASRQVSTLGYERRFTPALQLSREEFVALQAAVRHPLPPYFRRCEELNRRGARLRPPPEPAPRPAQGFAAGATQVVDVRSPEAFAGCSIPGSLALPLPLLSSHAGWFLDAERAIGLVADDPEQAREAARLLFRMGYTNVESFLAGGIRAWQTAGAPLQSIGCVDVGQLRARIARSEALTLLDVRRADEFAAGHLPGAIHAFVGELPGGLEIEPLETPIVTYCGSGRRALLAASLLRRAGVEQVETFFGSMQAWRAAHAPVEQAALVG